MAMHARMRGTTLNVYNLYYANTYVTGIPTYLEISRGTRDSYTQVKMKL